MNINLRPQSFKEFIGQERLKATVEILIKAANKQNKPLDHLLFYGPSGLGKTSLAHLIAITSKRSIRFAQGPLLVTKADVLALFATLKKHSIIFIDEIHSINKITMEIIYHALEDGVIDLMIGPEGDKRLMRLKLPPFTLIGATTQKGKLALPLLERFGLVAKLNTYCKIDIKKVLQNSAHKMKIEITNAALEHLLEYTKNNPRLANNLLKRIQDFLVVTNQTKVDVKLVSKTLRALGIYQWGFNELHLTYLKTLHLTFANKPTSIETITGVLQENKHYLEQIIEVDLLKKQLIVKTTKGRQITNQGIKYLSSIILV